MWWILIRLGVIIVGGSFVTNPIFSFGLGSFVLVNFSLYIEDAHGL
jgi:hypothetical protein